MQGYKLSDKDDNMAVHKEKNLKWLVWMAVVILIAAAILIVLSFFHISELVIEGNEHYTDDEIEAMIFGNNIDYNTFYLYWKYHYTETEEIPFIDTVEVSILSPRKVKIVVYEKGIVGYVEHLGHYLYFDKDGTVVESSTEVIDGIPCISGLNFKYIVLYEKLPVENEAVFKTILNLTQLLKKYEVYPDRIYFSQSLEVTLHFKEARVQLGADTGYDEKIVKLKYLIDDLAGLSGVLHLENYDDDTKIITFQKE